MRISIGSAVAALALMGGIAAPGETPVAHAKPIHIKPVHAKPMQISASGGDRTSVDHDGTQGDFTDSVQGLKDSDGDQDAGPATNSEEAAPQIRGKLTRR